MIRSSKLGAVAAALVALALLVAACGGDDDESTDPVTTTDPPAAPGNAADVCTGTPNESAPNYDQGAGTVAAYEREEGADEYEFRSLAGVLPEGSEALVPSDASLVLCMDITSSEVVDVCNYEDSDSGEEFRIEIANATYDVALYEANTATEIETASDFEGEASDCPAFASFTEGEESKVDYADPEDDLNGFLRRFIAAGK